MTERRNQGFLTLKDRTTLRESLPGQYPPHFSDRTREKLKQGLADLAFTAEKLDDENIAEAFNVLSDPDLQEETTYTHEKFTRKTIVNALALFIQATHLVGAGDDTALEDLIRDAIVKASHRSHPRQAVGSVSVEVDAAPRQEAYDRGCEKYRDGEWLTSPEMRALIDADYLNDDMIDDNYVPLQPPDKGFPSPSDLIQYIIDHLAELESGLELSELQQTQQSNRSRDADIICEDQDGQIVLIQVLNTRPTRYHVKEFESLIEEYGGFDRARAILIIPRTVNPAPEVFKSDIDLRAILVDRLGTIHGITDPLSS